jgi:3-hydroxybutyryl-CoA dehydratase
MKGLSIDQLEVGQSAEFSKTVSESDVYLYAGVTGDLNPAHINETYAQNTFFKTRIAHGMLTAGFISAVMGTMLPGPGTIYLKQELRFLAPVRIGDTVTARCEVAKINAEKNQVVMQTTCSNQKGTKLVDGQAIVSPPKKMPA